MEQTKTQNGFCMRSGFSCCRWLACAQEACEPARANELVFLDECNAKVSCKNQTRTIYEDRDASLSSVIDNERKYKDIHRLVYATCDGVNENNRPFIVFSLMAPNSCNVNT